MNPDPDMTGIRSVLIPILVMAARTTALAFFHYIHTPGNYAVPAVNSCWQIGNYLLPKANRFWITNGASRAASITRGRKRSRLGLPIGYSNITRPRPNALESLTADKTECPEAAPTARPRYLFPHSTGAVALIRGC